MRVFSIIEKKQNAVLLVVGNELRRERLQNFLKDLAIKNINVAHMLRTS